MNQAQALALLATLKAAYPRQEIGEDTLAIYALDLADLEFEQAKAAVEHCRRTCRFFPTIAEIREAAAEAALGGAPAPMEAWSELESKLSTKEPLHPLVAEAKRQVGDGWWWRTQPVERLRREFLEAYRALRSARVRAEAVGKPHDLKAADLPAIEAGE